jgi:hypothetical protein
LFATYVTTYYMKSIAHADPCVNGTSDRLNRSLSHTPTPSVSDALREANARLTTLRTRLDARQRRACQAEQAQSINAGERPDLPPHLGWDSVALSRVFHTSSRLNTAKEASPKNREQCIESAIRIVSKQLFSSKTKYIKTYPTLLSAILKRDLATAGRVWLLGQHIDSDGRGWVAIDQLRWQLTGSGKWDSAEKTTVTRICGWRRLRQILTQGRGVFWDKDDFGRLWLYGSARVAAILEIDRLRDRPVKLPLKDLTASIGQVRATFYAAFHAGRQKNTTPAAPISRASVKAATGVAPRTQWHYENETGIERQFNFVIGRTWSVQNAQNAAWRHGNGTFCLTDTFGRNGAKGKQYVARQLPNSYTATLATGARGRQRKVNRKLTDLVQKGAGERSTETITQLYYTSAATAIKATQPQCETHWQIKSLKHDATLWGTMQR